MSFSPERKAAVVKQMLPPNNISIAKLSEKEGISCATLYKWRDEARSGGAVLPNAGRAGDDWSAVDKFNAVLQCATLSQSEVSTYCRERGLYVEQIAQWREACEKANDWDAQSTKAQRQAQRDDKVRVKRLEREIHRKDKALAEAAALLVLRKKFNTIWGEAEEA